MFGAAIGVLAGHEVTYYPSFYPSEITLSTLDPEAAAKALAANKLHVYFGAAARFPQAVPESIRIASSLGGYVLVTLDPGTQSLAKAAARCAVAAEVLASLADVPAGDFVFHPYPITPFHEDYVAHADRVARDRQQARSRQSSRRGQAIQATGELARHLAQAGWIVSPDKAPSGLALIEVPEEQALAPVGFAGWSGPPWIKEGWYEAWRLLIPGLEAQALAQAKPLAERLMRGDFDGRVESFNLERKLVDALQRPCTRVAAGYTLRREYYNDDYAFGVENIAPDSTQGLNNPVFLRTVKLKDYPWNGPLFGALKARPKAAWNPVAGFGDAGGRLVWSIVADDAFMRLPDGAGWQPNRMDPLKTEVRQSRKAAIPVPADALLPEPGTGILRAVGPGKKSQAKVVYRVLSSPFLDGLDTEVEDLLYPYAVAFRWGGGPEERRDPAVMAATALLRERLVGVRFAGTQRSVDQMSGIEVPRVVHTIEVYVNHAALDSRQVAALAPPWSAVPWQLVALLEEAVTRGLGAFSEQEALRRGVPWLDLARDPQMLERLRGLVAEFQRTQYRPPELASGALAALVSPETAAKRWAALAAFASAHGHLLDTNGPYVLKRLGADRISFEVVRDFRYAIGLGTFNLLADAPSARVTAIQRKGRQVHFEAELETIERVQRDTVVTRGPYGRNAARGFKAIATRARLVVIGPDGAVVASRLPKWQEDGRFVATLPAELPKGKYTVSAAVYADENTARAGTGTLTVDVH